MADKVQEVVKSPKLLKKEEKARLAAEKKAKKEAEKAAKKAEKERLAAEKKAKKSAKAAGKKGKHADPAAVPAPPPGAAGPDATEAAAAPAAAADGAAPNPTSHLDLVTSSETATDSPVRDLAVDGTPHPMSPRSVLSAGASPDVESMVANGVGRVAQAWMTGHPGEELGLTAFTVTPDKLIDDDFTNLGEGSFGMIYTCEMSRDGSGRHRDGHAGNASVVVKSLAKSATAEDAERFAAEAAAMEKLDHPNVLRILGSAMEGESRVMIFEGHAHGVLKTYLEACKATAKLSALQQVRLGADVAAGLAYLHSIGAVHRDLAARNCLVSEDDVVRIGDFGLGQLKFPGDYHAIDGVLFPVRWMAPECFRDHAFSEASDVWSAGVVLWEIACHGNNPFPKLASSDIADEVLSGATNVAPKGCSGKLAAVIASCQLGTADERPTAAKLSDELQSLSRELADAVAAEGEAAAASNGAAAVAPAADAGAAAAPEANGTASTDNKPADAVGANGASTNEAAASAEASAAPQDGGDGYSEPADGVSKADPVAAGTESKPKASSRFNKLKKTKKSFRSLGQFKEADNPSEALNASTSKKNARELDRGALALSGELGQGAFGVVVKGKLTLEDGRSVPCACKTLKDRGNAEDLDALEAEAELVSQFDHENVVKCFGKVTKGDPAMIVFEFMSNGSLFSYLQGLPEVPKLQRLMQIAIDIASGMAYLAEGNNVHRDLATRNVLVNEELSCKISDFGLSRDLDDDTYYESDGGMVPIRWTPPEAYKYKKYSTASDVWSYGITLYEVWTKGSLPYGRKWTNMNVMMEVEKGYRLAAPPRCPKAVYQLMLKCWNPLRKLRPEFQAIREQLQMAHDLMFPPAEEMIVEEPDLDTEYGDMDQMYYGVDVPPEGDLDKMSPPPPTVEAAPPPTSSAALKLASELEGRAAKADAGGGARPDRFAHILKGPRPVSTVSSAPGVHGGNPASNEGASPSLARKEGGSLRKQKVASDIVEEEEGSAPIDNSSGTRVKDMISLSKAKEEQSAAELAGIAKLQKAGVTTPTVEPNAYVESVGRAVEGVAEVKIGKRKRCVCRRFKCVCGARPPGK